MNRPHSVPLQTLVERGLLLLLAAALLAGCAAPVSSAASVSAVPSSAASALSGAQAESRSVSSSNMLSPLAPAEPAEPLPEVPNSTLPPLHVQGTGLADPEGNAVRLQGISTHGLAWFPTYVNAECFAQLHDAWHANVIRLALYTAEYGGYCTGGDREALKQLVRDGVRYAAEAGMYVIVDWHILSDGDPTIYLEDAKAFFDEMCAEFAEETHVLYEICNEPNGGVTWQTVKAYAEQVIPVIRAHDPDAVILVGTPTWSQDIDQAAADPIADDNLMYTLHFYAATHGEWLRSRLTAALDAGLPVFVSEYGICDASGNGGIDEAQADAWMELMKARGVSCAAWNLSNKNETSALLQSTCDKTGGFVYEDLSASGRWLYAALRGENE